LHSGCKNAATQASEFLASKPGQASVPDTKADKLAPILPSEVKPSSWLDVISGQGEKSQSWLYSQVEYPDL
jgi:hypothetical protein